MSEQKYVKLFEEFINEGKVDKEIERIADALRDKGYEAYFDNKLPFIEIEDPDGEGVWSAQEHEAEKYIEETPDNVTVEDYVLFMANSAGILDDPVA